MLELQLNPVSEIRRLVDSLNKGQMPGKPTFISWRHQITTSHSPNKLSIKPTLGLESQRDKLFNTPEPPADKANLANLDTKTIVYALMDDQVICRN